MKAALLPSSGIGDGLILLIAAHGLYRAGYEVTVFHNHLPGLSRWFPWCTFKKVPACEAFHEVFSRYDQVLLENDNRKESLTLMSLRTQQALPLSILYPSYSSTKHPPLTAQDFICASNQNMAENVTKGCCQLFHLPYSKHNGFLPPPHLHHRKNPLSIAIHPTSSNPNKNWSQRQFLLLGKKLLQKGFFPAFVVSAQERPFWMSAENDGIGVPLFDSLDSWASYIFETGAFIGTDSAGGHFASCAQIPHLIIAGNKRQMQLWRPGWLEGSLVLPPRWMPNWKGLRWREKGWHRFIPVSKVLHQFLRNCL